MSRLSIVQHGQRAGLLLQALREVQPRAALQQRSPPPGSNFVRATGSRRVDIVSHWPEETKTQAENVGWRTD
jgi:hypothetical protein